MTKLILDALFPPPPDQLVQDLNDVGADGAAVYVWRPGGVGTWTPAHVVALRAAGKLAFPIIVPQPDGGDINGMLGMAQFFGFMDGPITVDAEPPNLPPASWEENFDSAAAALGFQDFDYGTPGNLGLYQPDDENWVAEWIRTGQLQPLPVLPPGRQGWQFVNDIVVNGHGYDASVIAASVFGGMTMSVVGLDPNDPTVQQIWTAAARAAGAVIDGQDEFPDFKGGAVVAGSSNNFVANRLNDILAAVKALNQAPPAVDVNALAAALIPHLPPSIDPQVVAQDVLDKLAAQLAKP